MTRLRYASLVLLVAAAALAVGTGAITSAETSRTTNVEVAEDDALLGIDLPDHTPEITNESSDKVTLLDVTNRHVTEITVTAEIVGSTADSDLKIEGIHDGETVISGDTAEVTADVRCGDIPAGSERDVKLDLHVTAENGSGFAVETTETVSVTCKAQPPN